MDDVKYKYRQEFDCERQRLFVSRLGLFCYLAVAIYIGSAVLAAALDPFDFRKSELITWAFLIFSAGVSLFINSRVKTFLASKLNASLFSCALAATITGLFAVYPEYIGQASEIFALSVFLISFTMPWRAAEAAAIGFIHLACYTYIFAEAFMSAPNALDVNRIIYSGGGYVDGLVFLVIAVIICAVIKTRDYKNDRQRFSLLKELEARNAEMQRELSIARDVHKTLIPKSTSTDNAAIAVSYVPLSAVGGDYATFHVTKDGNLFFLIGDVTGHGVPAALLVNRIYGEVESLISRNPDPGILMRELDRFVQSHFKHTRMYFSVCAGLLDFKTSTLSYSNYGHPPQILHQNKDNTISLLKSQTYLLGIDIGGEDQGLYEGSLKFSRKDRIVLFTDGLIEAKGDEGEFYGMERLQAFVKSRSQDPAALFNTALLGEVDRFKKGPLADDIFLVTIDIK
jgi:sigma-B regulation protein RsbU (phosphoserine phosphatase)